MVNSATHTLMRHGGRLHSVRVYTLDHRRQIGSS